MKICYAFLLAVILSATSHAEEYKIPRGVFSHNEIEQAQADAVRQEKGLAFVLGRSGMNSSDTLSRIQLAFKKLKSRHVMVFIDVNDRACWQQASPMVMTGARTKFEGKDMGFPCAVVTSPDMMHIWGRLNYYQLKEDSAYRDLGRQVQAMSRGKTQPDNPLNLIIHWPGADSSSSFIGTFLGIDEGKSQLRIKHEKGRVMNVAFDRVSGSSVEFARNLAALQKDSTPLQGLD